MVLTWRHIVRIISVITIGFLPPLSKARADPSDWRQIEMLAEQHPYVVALLDSNQEYVCTGTIINKRTVLTAGNCIAFNPTAVVVGAAIYGKRTNNNTILEVDYTRVHIDYTFELKAADPNVTRMHSNIGIVMVKRPILEVYIVGANIGNYYASELQNKKLKAVGYGKLDESEVVVLQFQTYRQAPCTNPKWYYCICGLESKSRHRTYIHEFGKGSPIVYGSEVVGVAAITGGTLILKNFKYNIFTVIGPYLPWIDKSQGNETNVVLHVRRSTGLNIQQDLLIQCVYILIMLSKILY